MKGIELRGLILAALIFLVSIFAITGFRLSRNFSIDVKNVCPGVFVETTST
jgi:hypothetical protein